MLGMVIVYPLRPRCARPPLPSSAQAQYRAPRRLRQGLLTPLHLLSPRGLPRGEGPAAGGAALGSAVNSERSAEFLQGEFTSPEDDKWNGSPRGLPRGDGLREQKAAGEGKPGTAGSPEHAVRHRIRKTAP